ncbi:MAG: glycogen debranching N-terminal domain-containing protein, partial [Chloroflexota bacterium]
MVEDRIDAIDFYIHATSTPADDRTRVLKHGESFAVFNRYGDIRPLGLGEQGLYHGGTRYLSRFVMTIEGGPPILLSSTMRRDDLVFTVDVTNLEIRRDGQVVVPQDTIHISRSTLLWDGVCHQQLEITNYGDGVVDLQLGFVYDADYADIFEVRGLKRKAHGEMMPVEIVERGARLAYHGLDDVRRATRIVCTPAPDEIDENHLALNVHLLAGEQRTYEIAIVCEDGDTRSRPSFQVALAAAEESLGRARQREAQISTSNEQFNDWLDRSLADVRVLTTRTPDGYYPYAGVPWFSTPFGRDGLITALQMLWVNPELARGVLAYLAATQATEYDPEADAQPGKILHETRSGEMAALGEHPFRKYYGTADATPLFIMLAGQYYQATADRELICSIWPNIEAALEWIDGDGDPDGDGFVEYSKSPVGLVHQGWKDSNDSVFHLDGSPATHPIALAEV